ncbi:MAG: DUF4959 domain-containing protein [Tannerella sp.]|nr:DUF4959 domain-containing protein [Tannerella sp.]
MKRLFFIAMLGVACACSEEPIGQTPMDSSAPGTVSNIVAVGTPGGAIITYDLPEDADLLCVKALFELKDGQTSEVKASVFAHSLEILGFGDTNPRTIRLVSVDRSRNESQPATVNVTPLTPPFVAVQQSLQLTATYGGLNVTLLNPSEANIVVCIERKNAEGKYVTVSKIYTKLSGGLFKIRGMEAVESELRYYVSDPWNNVSEIAEVTLTPLYEIRIPSRRIVTMADYSTPFAWGWQLPGLFDDNSGTGFHTEVVTGLWPHHFNFNIADGPIRISRIRVIQRDAFEFQHGMMRKFTVYGSNTPPNRVETDYSYWHKIGDFESHKPSGLPIGQNTAEDIQLARGGEDFEVDPGDFYKYFRVDVTQSWSGQPFICFMEFQLWGTPDGFTFPTN